MSRGRKPKGRSPHLNVGRVTRAVGRHIATQAPGSGVWRNRHDRKTGYPRFCEAMKVERSMHRGAQLAMTERRGARHEVYDCTYGDHYLITGPRHWHVGRPVC